MSAAVAAVKLQPTTQISDDSSQTIVPSDSSLDVTDSMSFLDQDQIDQYVIYSVLLSFEFFPFLAVLGSTVALMVRCSVRLSVVCL